MKKLLTLSLAGLFVFSIVACNTVSGVQKDAQAGKQTVEQITAEANNKAEVTSEKKASHDKKGSKNRLVEKCEIKKPKKCK